jgi:hypothetical protein
MVKNVKVPTEIFCEIFKYLNLVDESKLDAFKYAKFQTLKEWVGNKFCMTFANAYYQKYVNSKGEEKAAALAKYKEYRNAVTGGGSFGNI